MDLIKEAQRALISALFRRFPDSLVWIGGSLLQLVHHSPRISLDLDFLPTGDIPPHADLIAAAQEAVSLTNTIIGSEFFLADRIESRDGFLRLFIEDRSSEPPATAFSLDITRIAGSGFHTSQILLQSVLGTASVRAVSEPDLLAQKLSALLLRRFLKPGDLFDVWFLLQRGILLTEPIRLTLRDELTGAGIDLETIRERLSPFANPGPPGDKWLASLRKTGVTGLDPAIAAQILKTVQDYLREVLE